MPSVARQLIEEIQDSEDSPDLLVAREGIARDVTGIGYAGGCLRGRAVLSVLMCRLRSGSGNRNSESRTTASGWSLSQWSMNTANCNSLFLPPCNVRGTRSTKEST